ncbi:MAG: ABC transporter permease [Nocardioidaceae bacterium]
MTLTSGMGPRLAADVTEKCYTATNNQWICADYWRDFRPELVEATKEHIWITIISVGLGLALALPLAVIARRFMRLEGLIVGTTTVIYTVPSLAMFSLLLPFTGISATSVIIGLALYSLTILVRNILAGLRGVPDEVKESAVGSGYGSARLLLKVELPLAMPVIVAGLRVATVSTVALTTVGTILDAGGLGDLLSEGVNSDFKAQIFAASVLCVALAVVLDLMIVVGEWLSLPWVRAGGRA